MLVYVLIAVVLLTVVFAFVAYPLFHRNAKIPLLDSDEGELRSAEDLKEVFSLRDALLNYVSGKEAAPIPGLSKEEAMDYLISVCLRLKKMGMPYLGVLLCLFVGFEALAQTRPDVGQVPTLFPVDDKFIPQVHEYLIEPGIEEVFVKYTGVFRSAESRAVNLILPLPTGFQDLEISQPTAAVVKEQFRGVPVISISEVAGKMGHVQTQFRMPAPAGELKFNNDALPALPGIVVLTLRGQPGVMRDLLAAFSADLNIWPMRAILVPADFKRSETLLPLYSTDPMFQQMPEPPGTQQLVRYIRMPNAAEQRFPVLVLNGIMTPRLWIYVLGGTFAILLSGLLVFSIRRLR